MHPYSWRKNTLKITQVALKQRLGVSTAYISDIENGRVPSGDIMQKYYEQSDEQVTPSDFGKPRPVN